jgi:hypothetical protein
MKICNETIKGKEKTNFAALLLEQDLDIRLLLGTSAHGDAGGLISHR